MAVKPRQDVLRDLVVGVAHHRLASLQRERVGGTGVEQTQKVVQLVTVPTVERGFSRRSFARWPPRGSALKSTPRQAAWGRREVPGVGAERLQKPTLALGVQVSKAKLDFTSADLNTTSLFRGSTTSIR